MLQKKIIEDMQKAMKEKDEIRLLVLRGLMTAFTNELVSKKQKPDAELPDEEALEVIQREAKQRKDSIEQFNKGGRADLAESEEKELAILEEYLPEMMGREDIEKLAKAKKEELGVDDRAKMGMLMGSLMKDLKGKADGGDVKAVVESLF
jgi:uncharacterized protein YqeY